MDRSRENSSKYLQKDTESELDRSVSLGANLGDGHSENLEIFF